MKAIYQETPNCQPCIDFFGYGTVECKRCKELHRYDVDILEFGVGMFGNKAVIQKEDGTLETVSVKSLKLRDCKNCDNHKTVNCPNSSLCYATDDKPFFVLKEGK